jgi:nucleoside-diphosphate-sugar epimerase
MIIGNGLIGTEMKKIDFDDILFFCSGVSDSTVTSQKLFQREIDLLNSITTNFEYDKIIYFGSLPNLSNKIFLEHKGNVENKIKALNKKYIIVRSPNLIGNTGHHNNLIPYWVNCVKKSLPVNIYETFRSILDVSDLRRIVEYLLLDGFNGEIDINYIELIRPESLLDIISKILKRTPKISKYVRGSDKFIINRNNDYVTHLLRELSIGEVGYTKTVLEKYCA